MLLTTPAMPRDGRQSETAHAISRGAQRLLLSLGLACVSELPLASGRRADLVALGGDGEVWIVEIKSSVEDFRADRKWPDYRMHCDRLFFATGVHVPVAIFPAEAPRIVLYLAIVKPKGESYYGGRIAAPVVPMRLSCTS